MISWEHDNDMTGSFGHFTAEILDHGNAEYATSRWCEHVGDNRIVRSTEACSNLFGRQIPKMTFNGESTFVTFQSISNAD